MVSVWLVFGLFGPQSLGPVVSSRPPPPSGPTGEDIARMAIQTFKQKVNLFKDMDDELLRKEIEKLEQRKAAARAAKNAAAAKELEEKERMQAFLLKQQKAKIEANDLALAKKLADDDRARLAREAAQQAQDSQLAKDMAEMEAAGARRAKLLQEQEDAELARMLNNQL